MRGIIFQNCTVLPMLTDVLQDRLIHKHRHTLSDSELYKEFFHWKILYTF
jgi:hypothetical protein